MKYYLSSYRLGNKGTELAGTKLAYIPNALDFPHVDVQRRDKHIQRDLAELRAAGIDASLLD